MAASGEIKEESEKAASAESEEKHQHRKKAKMTSAKWRRGGEENISIK